MKKLLWVLVLGGALLFPIVGLADTEGDASATLTLTAVINVNVDGDLSASIDQPGLDALAAAAGYSGVGTTILWLDFTGLIKVEVVALTSFKVHMSYDYVITTGTGTLGTLNQVLFLMDPSLADIGYIPWAAAGGGLPGTTLIVPGFLGENNTPGETEEFALKVNLDELGDRDAGDVITFTITVWIEDDSV